MNYNHVQIGGRLTRDPEVRYTPAGTAVTDIAVAVNHKKDGVDKTTFIDITFWSDAAENVGKWFSKGDPIFVTGRLHMEQWEDRETGKKRSKLKVVGFGWQFCGPTAKSKAEQTGGTITGGPPRHTDLPHHSEVDPGEGSEIPF